MARHMTPPIVKFSRLHPAAIIPTAATEGAACFDLYSLWSTTLTSTVSRLVVETGVGIELPPGYVGLVCSRSGLAANNGVFVLNAPGVIDEDYRGELKIILGYLPQDLNWPSIHPRHFDAGSRLAQLMILPRPQLQVAVVDQLSTTERGAKGLGSSGLT